MSKVNNKAIEKHFRISKNIVLFRENNNFAEFMVHLIHRKRVPLLHNTVLIVCNEGDGLVAVPIDLFQKFV